MAATKINIENIDKARTYFKEKKNEVYKLTGHPLAKESDYVKELYVAFLCSISAYDGELADGEINYIKRVINGIELKTDFAKIVKLGIELDQKTIDEFIKAFSGNDFAHSFLADALVVAASDGVILEKEVELIADITEILIIKQDDVKEVSNFVSILFKQKVEELLEYISLGKLKINFDYLIRSFFPEYINLADYEYITGSIEYKADKIFTKAVIRFENATIKIADKISLKFIGHHKIEFSNCEIVGGNNNPLRISQTSEVKIDKCLFKSFRTRVCWFDNISNLIVKNTIFERCGHYYKAEDEEYGGIFLIAASKSVITNCIFVECFIQNLESDWLNDSWDFVPMGFLAGFDCSESLISDNLFKGCYAKDAKYTQDESFYCEGDECKITEYHNQFE